MLESTNIVVLMPIFDKKPNGRRNPTIGEGERKREIKEVINPMGQHGKPIGMARKGTTEMEAQQAGQAGVSTKTMSRPMKGIKGGGASPRAHALHTIGELTQWPEHHLLVPNQYRRGGPLVKGFKECGLVVGRKWGLFWDFYRDFFWEECLARMTFHPKEASNGLGPFNACHKGK